MNPSSDIRRATHPAEFEANATSDSDVGTLVSKALAPQLDRYRGNAIRLLDDLEAATDPAVEARQVLLSSGLGAHLPRPLGDLPALMEHVRAMRRLLSGSASAQRGRRIAKEVPRDSGAAVIRQGAGH